MSEVLFRVNYDGIKAFLLEDPVRPSIPFHQRMDDHRYVFCVGENHRRPFAILCCSVQEKIPKEEDELFILGEKNSIAVFYSVWSYAPGHAGKLIHRAKKYFEKRNIGIQRYITLSPKTKMAHDFHLRNGAVVLKRNKTTINYEYA